MSKTKLIPLFRSGYSPEVPTFTKNGEGINVSRFEKINIDVPRGEGQTGEDITLSDYVAAFNAGTLVSGKIYSVITPG